MKPLLVVTTSGGYEHIVPIFIHLHQTYWKDPNQRVEIVGYKKPDFEMPDNFSFYSMGEQKGSYSKSFGTDLRQYFARLDRLFIWCMEDSFTKSSVYSAAIDYAVSLMQADHSIGRLHLGPNSLNRYTLQYDKEKYGDEIVQTVSTSEYKLSTQIAIWNRDYLLKYLQPDMSPWEFECQFKIEDEFKNIAFSEPLVQHNEGVRKHDLRKYDLAGIPKEVINEMKQKGII